MKKSIIETLKLGLPIIIGQLGTILMGVVDTIMVGKLGSVELASAGFVNSVYFFFIIFPIGVLYIMSPLISASKAQDNKTETTSLLQSGIIVSIVMSVIFSLILYFVGCYYHYLGQDPDVIQASKGYSDILIWGTLPLLVFVALKQFTDSIEKPVVGMIITFMGLGINIVVNMTLIDGLYGFPQMGLNGAAWGTVLARSLMAVMIIGYLIIDKKCHQYLNLTFLKKINFSSFTRLMVLGLPSGLQFFFEVTAFCGAAVIVGVMGATQLAAHNIVINIASISYMMSTGLAAATGIRVGAAFGMKDQKGIIDAAKSGFYIVIVFMTFTLLFFTVFSAWIVNFYTIDPDTVAIALNLMIIAALFQLSDGIQVVALNVLRGIEDVKIPTIITLLAYWALGIPVGCILGFWFDLGPLGIWIGLLLGLLVSSIVLIIRFFKVSKIPL